MSNSLRSQSQARPEPANPRGGGPQCTAEHGAAGERRRLRSIDLLGGEGRVAIEHGGELYTLRRTRNGRLILTK